jgi:hypothetical protein
MDMSIGNFNYPTSYEYFNCENKEKIRVVINKADTGLRGVKFMYFVNLFIISIYL